MWIWTSGVQLTCKRRGREGVKEGGKEGGRERCASGCVERRRLPEKVIGRVGESIVCVTTFWVFGHVMFMGCESRGCEEK